MTLLQAQRAAELRLPITHKGVTYLRIFVIGEKYVDGRPVPFLQLLDKSGHSVTDANPAECTSMIDGREVS